jgi:4-hydroxy-2-oxoheptanedioate aldolase
MDGVDLLFVGPSDLSQVLGVIGQFDSPTLWDAYNRVAAACKKHGKHWGTIAVNPAFAQRAYDLGCRMLSFGIEAVMLRRGIEATKGQFKGLFA